MKNFLIIPSTLVIIASCLLIFLTNFSSAHTPSPTPNYPDSGEHGCRIGGCSGQLCVDGELGDVISSCEYRADYACYKSATCERQANGECGWTQTPQLTSCLQIPPPLK